MYSIRIFPAISMRLDGMSFGLEPPDDAKEYVYGDTFLSIDADFRPMVGDIYYIDDGTGYEVETVVYVGNNIFHAYAWNIAAPDEGGPFLGRRKDKNSIVRHVQGQIAAFPHRYQVDEAQS